MRLHALLATLLPLWMAGHGRAADDDESRTTDLELPLDEIAAYTTLTDSSIDWVRQLGHKIERYLTSLDLLDSHVIAPEPTTGERYVAAGVAVVRVFPVVGDVAEAGEDVVTALEVAAAAGEAAEAGENMHVVTHRRIREARDFRVGLTRADIKDIARILAARLAVDDAVAFLRIRGLESDTILDDVEQTFAVVKQAILAVSSDLKSKALGRHTARELVEEVLLRVQPSPRVRFLRLATELMADLSTHKSLNRISSGSVAVVWPGVRRSWLRRGVFAKWVAALSQALRAGQDGSVSELADVVAHIGFALSYLDEHYATEALDDRGAVELEGVLRHTSKPVAELRARLSLDGFSEHYLTTTLGFRASRHLAGRSVGTFLAQLWDCAISAYVQSLRQFLVGDDVALNDLVADLIFAQLPQTERAFGDRSKSEVWWMPTEREPSYADLVRTRPGLDLRAQSLVALLAGASDERVSELVSEMRAGDWDELMADKERARAVLCLLSVVQWGERPSLRHTHGRRRGYPWLRRNEHGLVAEWQEHVDANAGMRDSVLHIKLLGKRWHINW